MKSPSTTSLSSAVGVYSPGRRVEESSQKKWAIQVFHIVTSRNLLEEKPGACLGLSHSTDHRWTSLLSAYPGSGPTVIPGQWLPNWSLHPQSLSWTLDPNSIPPLRIIHWQFKLNKLETQHWTSTPKPVPPAVLPFRETANPSNQFFRPVPLKASLSPLSITPWIQSNSKAWTSAFEIHLFLPPFSLQPSRAHPHSSSGLFNSFLWDIQFWSPPPPWCYRALCSPRWSPYHPVGPHTGLCPKPHITLRVKSNVLSRVTL